ncbi:DUF1905 domain-containing protein [Demequina sp. B12]|uniref:DUF1905 domain-containing protein n=1 Tax=Demequina sp. B12 TaxID=2992757 RepID=UPI00237B608A|nr:DUF1905 domain-containing protein [Demequina sp. B12]MDE0572890.1 DUF1905 domain-containing protein [Demequina sp. B12]
MSPTHEFSARLWPWKARHQVWTFVTLPPDLSDEIEDLVQEPRRGFGAVKVRVHLGGSTWETSMFPSKEQGAHILPVKGAVRKAEGLDIEDSVTVRIELIDP